MVDYVFDVDDTESRLEYVCNQYIALKIVDPENDLLKFAGVTSSELFWNANHSEEFYAKFGEPKYISNSRANLDLNYGMALSSELSRLSERKSSIVPREITDKLGVTKNKSSITPDELLDTFTSFNNN